MLPIRSVAVWGRDRDKAERVAKALGYERLRAEVAPDLEATVAQADIVSCAALSTEPLVRGKWLQPGTHLDLVGGFIPSMREADDDAVRRAVVFIDTPSARTEAGDIVAPLRTRVLDPIAIRADLRDLLRGRHPGRSLDEITLFKSVGASEEELAAAVLAYERAR